MKRWIIASCALALVGTAHADEDVDEDGCPVAFKGAKVSAQTHPSGAQLEFKSGNRARISLMRLQLREVATLLEQKGSEKQTSSDDDVVEFPPVDIDVKDTTAGARVTVRVTRLRDLTPIRELAFGFAEYWKSSGCVAPAMASARESRRRGD